MVTFLSFPKLFSFLKTWTPRAEESGAIPRRSPPLPLLRPQALTRRPRRSSSWRTLRSSTRDRFDRSGGEESPLFSSGVSWWWRWRLLFGPSVEWCCCEICRFLFLCCLLFSCGRRPGWSSCPNGHAHCRHLWSHVPGFESKFTSSFEVLLVCSLQIS